MLDDLFAMDHSITGATGAILICPVALDELHVGVHWGLSGLFYRIVTTLVPLCTAIILARGDIIRVSEVLHILKSLITAGDPRNDLAVDS